MPLDRWANPLVYADEHGLRREYVQIKPAEPRLGPPSPDHPGGKEVKYEGPKGSQPHVYVSGPVADKVYRSNQILIVTEGMKKALAAAELGFVAVGLPGVWNWGAKKQMRKEKARLNADFDAIPLAGRTVVVFDSDAGVNKNVGRAEAGLVEALREAGAVVVRLLSGAGGGKVGLDDYVFTHGAAAFNALVAETVAAKPGGEQRPADELKVAAVKALAAIGRTQADLWHDVHMAWATLGRRSMKVRSTQFKLWLTNEYRKQAKDIPPAEALSNALNVIESEAVCDKPVRNVHVRIGGHGGNRTRFVQLTRSLRTRPGPAGRPTDKPEHNSAEDANAYQKSENESARTTPDKPDKQSRSPSSGRTWFGPISRAAAAKGGAP